MVLPPFSGLGLLMNAMKGGSAKSYARRQYIKTRKQRLPRYKRKYKKIKNNYINRLKAIDRKIMGNGSGQRGGGAAAGMMAGMLIPQLLPTIGKVLKVNV